MPPRKRTNQSKHTPPTSTSHTSAEQHHHLRHTGPSISTRTGFAATPSKPPPAPAEPKPTSESPSAQQGSREEKALAETSGIRTSFAKFTYTLFFLALLLFGWYVYGMVTLLERLKEEVGWWGIIAGDFGGVSRWGTLREWGFRSDRSRGAEAEASGDLEGSLNALADALGISPLQVASAVKPLIPQASLTSIASKQTGDSEAVRILYEDITRHGRGKSSTTAGVAEEFADRPGKGSDKE